MVTQKEIYSLTFLLLHIFDPTCKLLVKATSDIEINPAEWAIENPYDNMKSPKEIMDVPLRFEIRPTPVAFNMPASAYYNPEIKYKDIGEYDINPTHAIPAGDIPQFRHFIEKRQADDGQGSEGSGVGADCPNITGIMNGNFQTDPTCTAYNSFNCTVVFSCNTGYKQIGQAEIRCQANDTWSADVPTCDIVDCGNPEVSDSSYSGSTTYGGTVTITCNTNYNISGNKNATCQADGNYTVLPTCTYDCGDPPDLPNDVITVDCTVDNCFGDVTCADGYTFYGGNVTCVKDVGWILDYSCLEDGGNTSGVDISITLTAPPAENRTLFEATILQALIDYYQTQSEPGNFISVFLRSITYIILGDTGTRRKRQLSAGEFVQVNYTVIIQSDEASKGDFVKAQADLVAQKSLTINGKQEEVLRTSLLGFTFDKASLLKNGTLDTEGLKDISCQLFEVQLEGNSCPAGTECHITLEHETDKAFCQPIAKDDDFALKVGLGVGVPLFLIACAVIGCCVYYIILARRRRRRRRRKRPMPLDYSSSSSASISGFSRSGIATRFNTMGQTGPLYGPYFPEVWNGPESEDSFEVSARPQRRSSLPYVVSVGYEDREPYTSNFSWDFMYPHLRDDFSMPRPKL